MGAEWPDFQKYVDTYKINQLQEIKSSPQTLMFRHNQLEQEVHALKNRMENQVVVSNTATGCDLPSASQRFIHQETPMNQNKGFIQENQGLTKPYKMDIEHDSNPYPL